MSNVGTIHQYIQTQHYLSTTRTNIPTTSTYAPHIYPQHIPTNNIYLAKIHTYQQHTRIPTTPITTYETYLPTTHIYIYTYNTYLPTTHTQLSTTHIYKQHTHINNTCLSTSHNYLQHIPTKNTYLSTTHTYHMHVSLPMATHALNVYTHQFFYRIFCKLYVPTLSSLPTSCGLRRRRNPNFPCMYTAPSNNSNRQKLSLKNIFQSLQYTNLKKSLTINI